MKIEEYEAIISSIKGFQGLTKNCLSMLIKKYNNVQPLGLHNILTQEMSLRMKITHHRTFGRNVDYYNSYLIEFKKGEPAGILLRLANKLKTAPALLARKVLEEYCENLTDFKHTDISKMMKDTTLIRDKNLAYEIYLCILYDDQYGPIANAICHSCGEEYEVKLKLCLNERNIPYVTENYLRLKGYDKTPDCKLEIPIAVNGSIVNWIESKAQFGTPTAHSKYMKEQYLSYWNRFGPGLVIYWYGLVDSIIQPSETRFIVMEDFPENITYMDPMSIRPELG